MDKAIVVFRDVNSGFTEEIEIPLSITANDLVYALNSAYHLGIPTKNVGEHYLSSENPIALLRGSKTLKEYGLRNGSVIIYKRK